jgi:hypothetical protein
MNKPKGMCCANENHPADAAERATRMLERLARACRGCGTKSVSACQACVCATATALLQEMEQGRYRLGLVDLNTGKLDARDPALSNRASQERAKRRKAEGKRLKAEEGRSGESAGSGGNAIGGEAGEERESKP